MFDYKTAIKAKLAEVDSDAQYELFCDSSAKLPIITYVENGNTEVLQGDTLGYSDLSFIVKIWDTSISHAETWAASVDTKMRSLGFRRVGGTELIFDKNYCKVLTYRALAHETY